MRIKGNCEKKDEKCFIFDEIRREERFLELLYEGCLVFRE